MSQSPNNVGFNFSECVNFLVRASRQNERELARFLLLIPLYRLTQKVYARFKAHFNTSKSPMLHELTKKTVPHRCTFYLILDVISW